MLRIGHKGADALAPGNTLASFTAAAEAGVDAIEFDVLRPRGDFERAEDWRGARGGPGRASGPLLVAHDWAAAARREPLTLVDALDALAAPPLDRIRFDLDLKVAGREDEIIAALRERDLLERAMVSTMETSSLAWLRDSEPQVERGWTLPKVSRDWAASTWLRPIYYAGAATLRARFPADRRVGRAEARRLGRLDLPPAGHRAAAPLRARRRRPGDRLDRRRRGAHRRAEATRCRRHLHKRPASPHERRAPGGERRAQPFRFTAEFRSASVNPDVTSPG